MESTIRKERNIDCHTLQSKNPEITLLKSNTVQCSHIFRVSTFGPCKRKQYLIKLFIHQVKKYTRQKNFRSNSKDNVLKVL